MEEYISKSALVAEIERRISNHNKELQHASDEDFVSSWASDEENQKLALTALIPFLDTLEVKHDSLEKFKSLQHISGDLKSTLQDWGYAPNLYYFDGSWHVDWISCEEGDSIKGFTGDTVEEAINKACNWFHSTFCNG